MKKNSIRQLQCKVCKTRKARYVDQCCAACHFRVMYEGTQDLYGIPTKESIHKQWQDLATKYNKLARSGMSQGEIAKLWGMSPDKLRRKMQYIKATRKIKVVNFGGGKRGPDGKLVATAEIDNVRNEHGGGRWGVRGCKCNPCMQRRKDSRVEVRNSYKRPTQKMVKELQAQVAQLEAELAAMRKTKKT